MQFLTCAEVFGCRCHRGACRWVNDSADGRTDAEGWQRSSRVRGRALTDNSNGRRRLRSYGDSRQSRSTNNNKLTLTRRQPRRTDTSVTRTRTKMKITALRSTRVKWNVWVEQKRTSKKIKSTATTERRETKLINGGTKDFKTSVMQVN